ncbi:hypothetical protein ACYULU_00775 [Breznakiellaceae bacterium SP9]
MCMEVATTHMKVATMYMEAATMYIEAATMYIEATTMCMEAVTTHMEAVTTHMEAANMIKFFSHAYLLSLTLQTPPRHYQKRKRLSSDKKNTILGKAAKNIFQYFFIYFS